MNTNRCDHPRCPEQAAWRYRVVTLKGVRTTVACQGHVRDVRAAHGPNIIDVAKV
jgi:hypothetical protein